MKSVRNRINKGFTGTGLKIPKSENRKNPCFGEEKLSFGERTLRFWEIHFSFFQNVFFLLGKKKFLFFWNKKCECNFKTYEIFRNRTRHFCEWRSLFGRKSALSGKIAFIFGKIASFSGEKHPFFGKSSLFLGKEKHYAEKELQRTLL